MKPPTELIKAVKLAATLPLIVSAEGSSAYHRCKRRQRCDLGEWLREQERGEAGVNCVGTPSSPETPAGCRAARRLSCRPLGGRRESGGGAESSRVLQSQSKALTSFCLSFSLTWSGDASRCFVTHSRGHRLRKCRLTDEMPGGGHEEC